ncbi:MAG TPA: ATP-binding protein [Geminicoccaceae bacterium]|nr:ATP-binding protein [Geminicoccaceae bacterium]
MANLPSAVFCLDGGLRFVSANPAAEHLFSASWNVLEGRSLEAFVAPHTPLVDLVRQARRSGSSISDYGVELALLRGEGVSVDCHMAPLVENPEHVLVVLHPCSVARRLDQHLAHRGSARSVAALAATLAHEVKNPLSGIRGAAQLLEPYVADDDKALVKLIVDEADRIVTLVDRMEEFSESRPFERRPVNIHQVLEHVRRIAENGFARSHRIVELYDPSLPEVEGDRDKLIQVFLNLVKNAAEATSPEAGQITLVTHYQHGLRMSIGTSRERQDLPITVEVRDNGPGAREDLREHLFEPFVSSKPKGGGLGLPLVAKIVNDHGGMVSYVPGDPGAVFRVQLPAAGRRRGGGDGAGGARGGKDEP